MIVPNGNGDFSEATMLGRRLKTLDPWFTLALFDFLKMSNARGETSVCMMEKLIGTGFLTGLQKKKRMISIIDLLKDLYTVKQACRVC